MSLSAKELPEEILRQIFQQCAQSYAQLYKLSLVCRAFNRITASFLYACVEYSPPFRSVLDLKDRGEIPEGTMFRSACLPSNASFVSELRILGYLSTRPPSISPLATTIANAIRLFTNLSRVTFTPSSYHASVFVEPLEALSKYAKQLLELSVNSSCTKDAIESFIVQADHLQRLSFSSPGRAVLDALPSWIEILSKTLTGLHLRDNCGSVTPGVLTSLVPHVCDNLRELSLGLSYSLANKDVFSFLEQLPRLEKLQLQYYWQLHVPKKVNLPNLKYLTVKHTLATTQDQIVGLCRWVKAVTFASPIRDLWLVHDSADHGIPEIHTSFDILIEDLVRKHGTTLRILDLRSAYVSEASVRALFSGCLGLEAFYIAALEDALQTFLECSSQMRCLRSASFDIRNKKGTIGKEPVERLFSNGPPSLRHLVVNGSQWEGSWVSNDDRTVHFAVSAGS